MRRALFTLLAPLALTLAVVPMASASDGFRHDPRTQRQDARDDRSDYRSERYRGDGRRDARRPQAAAPLGHASRYAPPPRYAAPVRHAPPPRYYASRYAPPRHYQARQWRSGHYLPAPYRAQPYLIDYRHYRLAPPPRGYHYVRVDDHALLVAVTTGLVSEVLLNLFYR
jgi:Ni/Co efflux regulator RcnB